MPSGLRVSGNPGSKGASSGMDDMRYLTTSNFPSPWPSSIYLSLSLSFLFLSLSLDHLCASSLAYVSVIECDSSFIALATDVLQSLYRRLKP